MKKLTLLLLVAVAVLSMDSNAQIITTFAGTGTQGYSGDGGPAIDAELHASAGICLDLSGNVYIADLGNHRVRKIDAMTGIITTVAGSGITSYTVGVGGLV